MLCKTALVRFRLTLANVPHSRLKHEQYRVTRIFSEKSYSIPILPANCGKIQAKTVTILSGIK